MLSEYIESVQPGPYVLKGRGAQAGNRVYASDLASARDSARDMANTSGCRVCIYKITEEESNKEEQA